MPSRPYKEIFAADVGAAVISVSCTPNFSLVVAGAVDRHIHGFDHLGRVLWRQRLDHEVWCTAVASDGSRVAAGTANKRPAGGAVHLLDHDGKILWHERLGAPVWGVALSADGSFLVAGAWDGRLHAFAETDGAWARIGEVAVGAAGAYGVAISDDGKLIAAVAYGEGLKFFDRQLKEIGGVAGGDFGYRTALTATGGAAAVGMRDGTVALLRRGRRNGSRSKKLSQRPICGVGLTPTAKLVAAGGFDGVVHVCNERLDVLWDFRAEGEVWAVDISHDGRRLAVASGDGHVYGLGNLVTDAALTEIERLERKIERSASWPDRNAFIAQLRDAYADYGLVRYGLAKFAAWRAKGIIDETMAARESKRILESGIAADPGDTQARYRLAHLYEGDNDHWRAGLSYIHAARDPNLRQRAFTAAAVCMAKSNHLSAAQSCFRRAREQSLHADDLRILYNLARSLEDQGDVAAAKLHYDILLTWDPDYRDVAGRSLAIDQGDGANRRAADDAGLSVNLLGPDAPRYGDVDPALHGVLRARSRELHVSEAERRVFDEVLERFYRGDGIRAATRTRLGYDTLSYMKYDFLLPEDELKKEMERLNAFALIHGIAGIERSLDIGAATGRWPRTFAARGIEAHGIDIARDAIAYTNGKLTPAERAAGNPTLQVADALAMPFADNSFCLATCMMGTFAHIGKTNHVRYFAEARRVLRNGGHLLISTWDIECRHQSYLSMYSLSEKRMIDDNSLTSAQLRAAAETAGLTPVRQVPVCLVPDAISYDLGIKNIDAASLRRMLDIDLAARANFPDMHGQMLLSLFCKP